MKKKESRIQLKTFKKAKRYKNGAKDFFWFFFSILLFESSLPFPSCIKRFILRCFGADIGRGVIFKTRIKIKKPWLLSIGSDSWIGERVWIDNIDWVIIGADTCVSQAVVFVNGNHDFRDSEFPTFSAPIRVGEGAWIGALSIVLCGARVDNDQFVKAGSVVLPCEL